MVKIDNTSKGWGLAALGFIVAIEIAVIILLIWRIPKLDPSQETLRLPLMVLFGVIAFLGALTIAASVLNFFGLSNPLEALGLPQGSVRALIALSLILIFALMVIFMATNLGGPAVYEFSDNSTVIYGDKNYTATNGTISILVDPSAAAIDFSKQVLTTVSTLVVALAGFYFGTRSVAQAQQSKPEISILLDPKDPYKYKLTGKDDKVKITVTAKPGNEVIKAEIKDNNGKKGSIRPLSENEFEYTPPVVTDETTVILKFYLLKYPGDIEELRITIQPQVGISLNPKSPYTRTLTGNKDKDKVTITATAKPEKEKIKAKIKDDDKKGTLGTISQNKNEFEYTPPAVTKETTVTLQFYLEKYPDDVEEWAITIKPKP
jgi:hypothetical protein